MSEINVDFTCPECQAEFNLQPSIILESESICCPSCECTLTKEELENLKIAIKHMVSRH